MLVVRYQHVSRDHEHIISGGLLTGIIIDNMSDGDEIIIVEDIVKIN
jgi:hypothetical protein